MTRTRVRVASGIYQDAYGLAATVKVGALPQKEKRFPPETPLRQIKRWQDDTRAALRVLAPRYHRGSFAQDVRRYLERVQPNHIDARAFRQRTREIEAWLPIFGSRVRVTITAEEITAQLQIWRQTRSAKTCNHRRMALGHLYVTLDGRSLPNVVRDAIRFVAPDPQLQALPLATIDAVLDQLQPGTKTEARLRLMRWTGMRPSQMARLTVDSFQLEAAIPHVIVPRGKSGKVVRIPFVGRPALLAARRFLAIGAFGAWSQPSANRLLEAACVKAGVPRFNLYRIKHSIASSLRAVMDLADVRDILGHIDERTTAIYAPPIPKKIVAGFKHLTVPTARKTASGGRR